MVDNFNILNPGLAQGVESTKEGTPGRSGKPVIPEYITVHLGAPDEQAENVTLPFVDYVKNVASSEIYPTWPTAAILANIRAQVSFALNRIYTEYYRSRGYDFDITNNTQYDQKFIRDREIFANISELVDEVFNDYVVRQGSVQPLFTAYCNGTTSTCDGLSQWGTVELANQGLVSYEILQHYYGDDINIMFNTPVGNLRQSYPGVSLRLGIAGEDVRVIQMELNRIRQNYPALALIEVDGVYGPQTEAAVKTFQEIFNLPADGVIGKATWYKIKYIYNGIKGLSELEAEGLTPEEVVEILPRSFQEGDEGNTLRLVQYLLRIITEFDDSLPDVTESGIYDQNMVTAVNAFQEKYGLPITGIIDPETLLEINRVYNTTLSLIPPGGNPDPKELYPGRFLAYNMTGDDVINFQRLVNRAAEKHSFVPTVEITGVFDEPTRLAAIAIQTEGNLVNNGTVGPLTWEEAVRLANS